MKTTGSARSRASQVTATKAVVRWYLENHFRRPSDPGVIEMFCDSERVGAFAVDRRAVRAGDGRALFRLLVATAMFQRRQDVQVVEQNHRLEIGAGYLLKDKALQALCWRGVAIALPELICRRELQLRRQRGTQQLIGGSARCRLEGPQLDRGAARRGPGLLGRGFGIG